MRTKTFFRDTYALLDKYITSGIVTLMPWNFTFARGKYFWKDQVAATQDCIRRFDGSKWIAHIDHDEYITPAPGYDNIHDSLLNKRDYQKTVEIGLFSQLYGPFRVKPETQQENSNLVTETYSYSVDFVTSNRKVIVSPRNVDLFYHHYVYQNEAGKWRYNSNRKKEVYLSHYYYLKYNSFNEIIVPNDEWDVSKNLTFEITGNKEYFFNQKRVNQTIMRFLPQLKENVRQYKIENSIDESKWNIFQSIESSHLTTTTEERLKNGDMDSFPSCCVHKEINPYCPCKSTKRSDCGNRYNSWCHTTLFNKFGKLNYHFGRVSEEDKKIMEERLKKAEERRKKKEEEKKKKEKMG